MAMRIGSSVTTLSWIPSQLVTGLSKVIFGSGITHYDDPPPDILSDLEALRRGDGFRFANHLAGWVEVDGGRVADAGYDSSSGLTMGSTTIRLPGLGATFQGVPFPDLRREPEMTETSARFVQTVGGHSALPAPRRVSGAPFIKLESPTVWTTLALTLHADGRTEFELTGASSFPRHWVYDADGRLSAKAGLTDFKDWWLRAFGQNTPWGDEDTPALVTTVETALERALSNQVMHGGAKPNFRQLKPGALLTEQGTPGDELYLLLDGMLSVEIDNEVLAEVGPGAILGERALLEGGVRTSTLRAMTPVRVAVARADQIDRNALAEISGGHRREE
jgi:hypothetical protein